MTRLTFTMWRKDALALDLLSCSCGHRPNNHFTHGAKPCAHCECKKYDEQARRGVLRSDLSPADREALAYARSIVHDADTFGVDDTKKNLNALAVLERLIGEKP